MGLNRRLELFTSLPHHSGGVGQTCLRMRAKCHKKARKRLCKKDTLSGAHTTYTPKNANKRSPGNIAVATDCRAPCRPREKSRGIRASPCSPSSPYVTVCVAPPSSSHKYGERKDLLLCPPRASANLPAFQQLCGPLTFCGYCLQKRCLALRRFRESCDATHPPETFHIVRIVQQWPQMFAGHARGTTRGASPCASQMLAERDKIQIETRRLL